MTPRTDVVLTILSRPDKRDPRIVMDQVDAQVDMWLKRFTVVTGVIDDYGRMEPDYVHGDFYRPWRIFVCGTLQSGTCERMDKILRWVGQTYPWADLIYLEDDVVIPAGVLEVIRRVPVPDDCAFVSYCNLNTDERDAEFPTGHRSVASIIKYPLSMTSPLFWGSQCLRISSRAIAHYNMWVPVVNPLPGEFPHASDVHLQRAMAECAARSHEIPYYGRFSPSLVQHLPGRSIVDPSRPQTGPGRTAYDYRSDNVSLVGEVVPILHWEDVRR